MQQTEKYKLNLIEKTDTFSPDALNQNTQKVENALAAATAHADAGDAAVTAAFQAGDAALDGRVTALEARRIVVGHYTGNGYTQSIALGFTPAVVLFINNYEQMGMAYQGGDLSRGMEVVTGGFRVYQDSSNQINEQGKKHRFLAIL